MSYIYYILSILVVIGVPLILIYGFFFFFFWLSWKYPTCGVREQVMTGSEKIIQPPSPGSERWFGNHNGAELHSL